MRRLIALLGFWGTLFSIPATPLSAQEETPTKELLLFFDVSPDCASLEDDTRLSEAIVARLPEAFIIRNDSVVPDWSILWKKLDDGTCLLTMSNGTTRTNLALGPNASADEIDSAASRVVWISAFSKEDNLTSPEKPEESPSKDQPLEEKETEKNESGIDKKETEPNPEKKEPKVEPKKEKEENKGAEKKNEKGNSTNTIKAPPYNSKLAYDHIDLSLSLIPGVEYYSNETPHYRGVPALSFNLFGGSHIGLRGFELGFLWNHKSEFVDGVQIAAGANISDGPLIGLQIALVNIANGNSEGLQLGLTNFADDLNGLQLGLFNFGARAEVQVGLINIAEKTDLSLGIFNLNWGYSLHPVVWLGTDGLLIAGIQHGSENLKYSLLIGLVVPDEAIQVGGGVGYHTTGRYFFSGDLFAHQMLFLGDPIWKLSLNVQAKVSVGYRFSDRLALFAGASVNGLITTLPRAARIFPDADVSAVDDVRSLFLWPSLHVGMSF